MLALMHNRRVMIADARFELSVARWNKLDPQLTALARIGFGGPDRVQLVPRLRLLRSTFEGLDVTKIAAISDWRSSAAFTDIERRFVDYAEAMTATPPQVTDELAQTLRAYLGNAGLVELTMIVGVENLRSRFNSTLGLASQGFAEACRVPVTGD